MPSLKARLSKPFANIVAKRISKWADNPVKTQTKVFNQLIQQAKYTAFGRDHDFSSIYSYDDFKKKVPMRDYEALRPYVERVINGEKDVLWNGKPIYFAKTSGTTSGSKYIPK